MLIWLNNKCLLFKRELRKWRQQPEKLQRQ